MMKKYLISVLAVILLSVQTDKKSLLCHRWIQFAIKDARDTAPRSVSKDMGKECEFGLDGSYHEIMYNGKMKISGKWFFNADQTKMDFTMAEMNGQKLPDFPGAEDHINKIILKLTADTLIYGNEVYTNGVYGHDDWYFVRKK